MKTIQLDSIEAKGIVLEYKFSELSRYINSTYSFFNSEYANLGDCLEEQAKTLPPDIKQEFYEFHLEEIMEVREDFPRLLRNSATSACACLLAESSLTAVCA